MPDSINAALVAQFSDMVHVNAQQMQTRLRRTAQQRYVRGTEFLVNTSGLIEAEEITSRAAPKSYQDPGHGVRMCKMKMYEANILLDPKDELEILIDAQSNYARDVARAMYKVVDRTIIAALDATVLTGRYGDGTVTASADGVTTIVHGSTGMTFAKLRQTHANFTNNDVGNDLPVNFFLLGTGNQEGDMLNEEKLTSRDYGSQLYVEKGKVSKALGMDVILFGTPTNQPMLSKTSTTRKCFAYSEEAVTLGIGKDITLSITRRDDLKGNPNQVTAHFHLGAIRNDGKHVQIVQCTEA